METRPKIKLSLTPLDKIAEFISNILLIAMWLMIIYCFSKLPEIIPIHFDFSGKADDYGSKYTLLILPVLATIIFFGFSMLCKYPHIFNYPTKITEENALRQYTIATRLLRFIKMVVLLLFNLIILFTYQTTIGKANGLGLWFLPVTFSLLVIPVLISVVYSTKSNK